MKDFPTICSAIALFLLLALCLTLTSCAGSKSRTDQDNQPESAKLTEAEKAKERKHILKTADDTLLELYKHEPTVKDVLEKRMGMPCSPIQATISFCTSVGKVKVWRLRILTKNPFS